MKGQVNPVRILQFLLNEYDANWVTKVLSFLACEIIPKYL